MRAILLLPLLLLGACQTTAEQRDALVQAFGEAVFNYATNLEGTHRQPTGIKLARWVGPVHVHIVGEGLSPKQRNEIQRDILVFAQLAKIDFQEGDSQVTETEGNQLIVEVSKENTFTINKNELSRCYAHTSSRSDGSLSKVKIVLGQSNFKEDTKCIFHEFMHGVGFQGHTHGLDSTLSYFHGKQELTHWDDILLKTLYHAELKPGMTRAEALPIARKIISERLGI